MMLVRLAHPFYARTLEFIFGADRTRITRWTNTCIDWLFDCYNHLLQLNVARFTEKAQVYADAVGRKMGSADACRNLLMVDGIFVYVTLILLSKIATQTNPPLSTHRPICKPRLAQEIYYSGESCVRQPHAVRAVAFTHPHHSIHHPIRAPRILQGPRPQVPGVRRCQWPLRGFLRAT